MTALINARFHNIIIELNFGHFAHAMPYRSKKVGITVFRNKNAKEENVHTTL